MVHVLELDLELLGQMSVKVLKDWLQDDVKSTPDDCIVCAHLAACHFGNHTVQKCSFYQSLL